MVEEAIQDRFVNSTSMKDLYYAGVHFGHQKSHLNPKMKSFETSEDEMIHPEFYTKDFIKNKDITRGWYFLNPNEQQRLLTNVATDGAFEFESYDTMQGLTAYERNMEEISRGLDIMQNFKTSQRNDWYQKTFLLLIIKTKKSDYHKDKLMF